MIDLGAWLSEKHAIPGETPGVEGEGGPPDPDPV
jgi:endogenous inhibitor of DNA gyrase (YacG/DUF329 family)